jgi:uncharacterized Tic20 family protein
MDTRERDSRTWSMICHLSALAGFVVGFGNVLGPLIVWQIKKNELPEITPHGKAALNFQITLILINIIAAICFFGSIVSSIGFKSIGNINPTFPFLIGGGFIIGGLVLVVINVLGLIFTVIAATKANNGETYKYPFAIRFIK